MAGGGSEGAEETAEHILFTTEQGIVGRLEAVLAEQRADEEAREQTRQRIDAEELKSEAGNAAARRQELAEEREEA